MTQDYLAGPGVTTVWTSPSAPRDEDAAAIADRPDVAGWLAGLTLDGRLGLHQRTLTQLQEGEPVRIVEEGPDDWVRIGAYWQPNGGDQPGYLGWVRRPQLRLADGPAPLLPPGSEPAEREAIVESARQHVGLHYLWGGTSPLGLDCSGLVHTSYRRAGVVIPRDAGAQLASARKVRLGDEQPGDLYFFGPSLEKITHVGFVTGRRRMLHSPEDAALPGSGVILEEDLGPRLARTLVAAGRFLA